MGMWFTRDDSGFRGWVAAVRDGSLRTGLVNGDFTVTIVAPDDSAKTTPAITESSQKSGVYYFDILGAFLLTNGVGEYVVVVEVNTKTGPSGAPHIVDSMSAVLRVTQEDFDTLNTAIGVAVTGITANNALIKRALGLIGEYRRIDQINRTGGNLTSARVRVYGSKADYDAQTNELGTYTVDATFVSDLLATFGQYKV